MKMAHLLGSQSCLESLAADIEDIHETITDIFSRVGPVRFPSWKYPDKQSCDLDIGKLLKRYCYSKDEEHCKLSHIILFELLIDRFVLLMQALSSFCNHVASMSEKDRPGTGKAMGSAMSVGLVVKKCWNKMAHLYHIVQRELSESSNKDKKVIRLEKSISEMRQEMNLLVKTKNSPVNEDNKTKISATFHSSDMNLVEEKNGLIRHYCDVPTQTYDTAFVPCEACSRTQENLITVGQAVMKVCESQGLPSSLAKQKRLLKQSLLAAADVSRWAAEQSRDLTRINEHLDNLYSQIKPLQEKLSKSREKRKILEEQVKSLETNIEMEREKSLEVSKNLSEKLSEITQAKNELQVKSSEEIRDLNKRKNFLEIQLEKCELKFKDAMSKKLKLETDCEKLKSDLEKEKREKSQIEKTKEELNRTKYILKEVQDKLEKTTLELGKTEAKNKTLSQHDQVLQDKHDALLQRIDELDQDCEELRETVMDIEGERDDLRDILGETKLECEKLSDELTEKKEEIESIGFERDNLCKEIENMQKDVKRLEDELRVSDEKMQMIVQYPRDKEDLNEAALNSPQSISREMEKQIISNNVRIAMLEAENKKLRHSVEKLNEVQDEAKPVKLMDEPLLLWNSRKDSVKSRKEKPSSPFQSKLTRIQSDSESRIHGGSGTTDSQIVNSFRPRPPSASKLGHLNNLQNSREKVLEKRQARALSAKLAHSNKNVPTLMRNTSGCQSIVDDNSSIVYDPVSTFVCEACDKMFTTCKDLDIHKAFCYDMQTL